MIKYCQIINEETGLCAIAEGTNINKYIEMGMVELDVKYIKERSLLTDVKIFLKTIPAVLKGDGAY
jgi:lipopolysaccharide/colanic/teichoic acid biosynthesis glycosyltransferase